MESDVIQLIRETEKSSQIQYDKLKFYFFLFFIITDDTIAYTIATIATPITKYNSHPVCKMISIASIKKIIPIEAKIIPDCL